MDRRDDDTGHGSVPAHVVGPIPVDYLGQEHAALLSDGEAATLALVVPDGATPGWFGDPSEPSRARWWDGEAWTGRTRPFAASPPH